MNQTHNQADEKSTNERSNLSPGSGLETPIQYCPGVGPKRATQFQKLNIRTVGDLFWHVPRGYEDFHQRIPLNHVQPGQVVTVEVVVKYTEDRYLPRRAKAQHLIKAVVEDSTGSMQVTWFNQPFLTKHVVKGAKLVLHGKVERRDYLLQMNSPKLQVVGEDEDQSRAGILPLYPLVEGINQGSMRKIMGKALEKFLPLCEDVFPQTVLSQFDFPSRKEAFRVLHQPQPGEGAPVDSNAAEQNYLLPQGEEVQDWFEQMESDQPCSLWERSRKRLVFEEFFQYQFQLRRFSQNLKQMEGVPHITPKPDPWKASAKVLDGKNPHHWPALFIQSLPFELTKDQIRVCREFQEEMTQLQPMNRLLQGDVGSGKTVVSLYAMIVAAAGGFQAAMMAPTEILARQHAENLRQWTERIPHLNLVVLAGSASASERSEIYSLLKSGAVQIVIGTHALFQERVQFDNLGLVVVDEQHKFGVAQRQRLVDKGRHPDVIVATATPIPRTLSLTLFGDMDVSVIRSMPPGRPPLITRWTTQDKEKKLWQFVDEKIGEGQQVYVVCPLIETSETAANLPSAEDTYERLTREFLPNRRVAMLHGRYTAEEKQSLMEKMKMGEIDLVVSTTVIEVGVDMPNATIMVVMGAERFGLSQLHQLRGRVGRGSLKSYCILLTPVEISPLSEQRMRVLEKSRDGFLIAEEDLKLRGPGEHFGTRQSGHLRFRLADPFRDLELLQQARTAAHELYDRDPELQRPEHKRLQLELLCQSDVHAVQRPT